MDPSALVRRGQRAAEKLMVDTVRVARLGMPVTDPVTGEVTTPETFLYEGRGKVQTYEAQESNPEAGGQVATVQRYAVHVPVGSCDPKVGDVIAVVSARVDPLLTGRRYRVVALLHKSLPTAYRLGVEELV